MKIPKIPSTVLVLLFLLIPFTSMAVEHAPQEQNDRPIKETFDIRILQQGLSERTPGYIERSQSITAEGGEIPDVSPAFVFIRDTVNFLTAVVASFSLLVFIIGGIYLLISEGQEDRIQKGKQAMTFSLIGLVIALMAYVITTVVQSIFF